MVWAILTFVAGIWAWILIIAPLLKITIAESLSSSALDFSSTMVIFIIIGYVAGKSFEKADLSFIKKDK